MSGFLKKTKRDIEEIDFSISMSALFPREILEPLYHQYIHDHPPYDKTTLEIRGFYEFLLMQVAPDKILQELKK